MLLLLLKLFIFRLTSVSGDKTNLFIVKLLIFHPRINLSIYIHKLFFKTKIKKN